MSLKKLFGEIAKVEDQDDGTVIVEGYASADTVDSDGEIITSEAMKAALPDYMKVANIREMHQLKAAGVALSASVEADGRTKLCAHIVDSEAVKKVKAKVYKGFSIGGSVTSRDELNKTIVTGLQLSEISLVDRPANPDAVITCFKAESLDADVAPADQIKKGGYEVGEVAELAERVANMSNYLDYIAEHYEEAPLDVIAEVKSAAVALYASMSKLAVFEAERMTAVLTAEKAAQPDDLAKAGSRNSKGDQSVLNQALALLKQLGASDEEAETEGDESNKIAKMNKLSTEHDELQKRFNDTAAERDTLQKRVAELEALPEPAKGVVKTVGKSDDVTDPEELLKGFAPIVDSNGTLNEAATLMKAVHSGKI